MNEVQSKGFYEVSRAKNLSDVDVMTTLGTVKHFHPQVEILVVVEGAFKVSINATEKIMKKGSVCIADSFDTHSYEMIEKGLGYVVIVPKSSMLSEYNTVTKNMVFKDNFLFDKESYNTIKSLVMTLSESLTKYGRLHKKGLVLAIMGILIKKLPLERRADSNKVYLMKDVLEYIHDNLKEEITLEGIAKRFGYTPNHFSLIFRKFTQSKFNDYVNAARLEQAVVFMLADKTVLEAAMLAGFDSIRTFYRVFNEFYRTTPTNYLEQFDRLKKDESKVL